MSGRSVVPIDVTAMGPEVSILTLRLLKVLFEELKGEPGHFAAEAAIRAAAAICTGCANPGEKATVLLVGSEMFKRFAARSMPGGRPQ